MTSFSNLLEFCSFDTILKSETVNLESVKDLAINRDVLELYSPIICSKVLFLCSVFFVSSTSEEQKETAHGLIFSGTEINASITDYFHCLASFGADSRKCFPVCMILCDLLRKATVNDLVSSQNKAK